MQRLRAEPTIGEAYKLIERLTDRDRHNRWTNEQAMESAKYFIGGQVQFKYKIKKFGKKYAVQ